MIHDQKCCVPGEDLLTPRSGFAGWIQVGSLRTGDLARNRQLVSRINRTSAM